MQLLIDLLWYYPAVVMTWWTLATTLVAWLMPLNRAVPVIFGVHGMLMLLNPKDEILYQRPSVLMVLGFFAIGLIPIVNALLLAVHLFIAAVAGVEYLKRFKRKKIT